MSLVAKVDYASFRILETMQQGVALLDADLRVVIFNDRIGKLLRPQRGY
jgi:hypothetical protein